MTIDSVPDLKLAEPSPHDGLPCGSYSGRFSVPTGGIVMEMHGSEDAKLSNSGAHPPKNLPPTRDAPLTSVVLLKIVVPAQYARGLPHIIEASHCRICCTQLVPVSVIGRNFGGSATPTFTSSTIPSRSLPPMLGHQGRR